MALARLLTRRFRSAKLQHTKHMSETNSYREPQNTRTINSLDDNPCSRQGLFDGNPFCIGGVTAIHVTLRTENVPFVDRLSVADLAARHTKQRVSHQFSLEQIQPQRSTSSIHEDIRVDLRLLYRGQWNSNAHDGQCCIPLSPDCCSPPLVSTFFLCKYGLPHFQLSIKTSPWGLCKIEV